MLYPCQEQCHRHVRDVPLKSEVKAIYDGRLPVKVLPTIFKSLKVCFHYGCAALRVASVREWTIVNALHI